MVWDRGSDAVRAPRARRRTADAARSPARARGSPSAAPAHDAGGSGRSAPSGQKPKFSTIAAVTACASADRCGRARSAEARRSRHAARADAASGPRDQLAEQLDVVVARTEHPLVERLLSAHSAARTGAAPPSAARVHVRRPGIGASLACPTARSMTPPDRSGRHRPRSESARSRSCAASGRCRGTARRRASWWTPRTAPAATGRSCVTRT